MSSSFTRLSDADALAYLETKGYSCVRLDDVLKENVHGTDFDISGSRSALSWFLLAFCALVVYRMVVTYRRIKGVSN